MLDCVQQPVAVVNCTGGAMSQDDEERDATALVKLARDQARAADGRGGLEDLTFRDPDGLTDREVAIPPTIEDVLGTTAERDAERQRVMREGDTGFRAALDDLLVGGLTDVSIEPAAPAGTITDITSDNVKVSLMNTGTVRLQEEGSPSYWEMDPIVAADVGQRLIQMAMTYFSRQRMDQQGLDLKPKKPKLDLIRGAKLPKAGL